jgi:hypothetical protein
MFLPVSIGGVVGVLLVCFTNRNDLPQLITSAVPSLF